MTTKRHIANSLSNGISSDEAHAQPLNKSLPSTCILVISQDSHFNLLTIENLRAAAFFVEVACTSAQAQESIKQQQPDIILLDCSLENLNSFQLCKLLRTNPELIDTPIIMVTAPNDNESINKAYTAGATDFISKPINYLAFTHHIYFILKSSQNTHELRNPSLQLATLTTLKSAQRIARFGYWTWRIKDNHFEISAHLANLCGIELEQFDGTLQGFIQLVYPHDRNYVENLFATTTDLNSPQKIEYRLQVNHAEPIIVQQEIEAINNKDEFIITGTVQDITRQKADEQKIYQLSFYDNLTGLANRPYYIERINCLINTATRRNEQFAFLFINLDDFKEVNDRYGHHLGDQFLYAIAQRLKLVAREIDFIARLGGDEFCIIIDNVFDDNDVIKVIKRCLYQIKQPLTIDNHQLTPGASIGISIFPRDGNNMNDLITAADSAMFQAKQTGKHGYSFHSHNKSTPATLRREKEQLLREAFKQDQLILYYQPQLSMSNRQVVGMEALVRWQHPTLGIVTPDYFLDMIEQLGLQSELGVWAIKTACKQLADWHSCGLPYIQVAVNLFPTHFQDHQLVEIVKETLYETGVPAHFLELEVTESAMQTKGHIEVFKQLRNIGLKIAIDDFGTGFSCLASLKQLPLDCLKIDKIFIDDMLYNSHTVLLLGTIISLAHALDYSLIAEGVETEGQALRLQRLGCDIIQGYHFSKPLPADEIPEFVRKTLH